jgi:hypothetical protein
MRATQQAYLTTSYWALGLVMQNISLLCFRIENRFVYFYQEFCPQLMDICSFKVPLQVVLVTKC